MRKRKRPFVSQLATPLLLLPPTPILLLYEYSSKFLFSENVGRNKKLLLITHFKLG